MNITPDPAPAITELLTSLAGQPNTAHTLIRGLLALGWTPPTAPTLIEAAERQARVEGAVRATTAVQQLIIQNETVDLHGVQRIEDQHVREYRNGFRPYDDEGDETNTLDELETSAAVRALGDAKRVIMQMSDERLEEVEDIRPENRPDLVGDAAVVTRIQEADLLERLAPKIVLMLDGLSAEYQSGRGIGLR
jgi:hypothetical protein